MRRRIVLRRVLTGGISTNSVPAGSSPAPVRTPAPFGVVVLERCRWRVTRGLVFGTLLGPEATGPGCAAFGVSVVWDLCFWFPGCTDACMCPFGGVCGVCGTGLLFENYIVDASIFYKKQFPRI